MNTDTANMHDFEFLGSHFEVTEEFKKYNSIRSEQEIKASELEGSYLATNDKMKAELLRLGLPGEANYTDFVNKLPQTILLAASAGFTELQRYQNSVLAGIGKRIIFKYTKNDTVSADDIAAALYIDVEKYFSSFMNEVQQIDEMKQSFQAQREYNRLTRSDPSLIGIGFGFKGAIGAAAGSAVANTGASLIGAIGDGLIGAIDASKVKNETKKSINAFKVALRNAFVDLYRQLLAVCKTILYDELKAEIGILGIKPYKDLSDSQLQIINTKMENYDEAYSNGDIQAERYVSQIFNVLNEMPYAPKYYYSLYKVAKALGDKNAQERIINFAQYLGLDRRVMHMIEREIAESFKEAKAMKEDDIEAIEKKFAIISGLSGKEAEAETLRLKELLHIKKYICIAMGEDINYEEYTMDASGLLLWNGEPFSGFLKTRLGSGEVYEGDFKNGRFNGKGKFSTSEYVVYEGEWADGKKQGRGVYRSPKGDIYDACFENNNYLINKEFTLIFANGDVFNGVIFECFNDGRYGKMNGTLTYAAYDIVYTGEMFDFSPDGKGEAFFKNSGKRHKGKWEFGCSRIGGFFSDDYHVLAKGGKGKTK